MVKLGDVNPVTWDAMVDQMVLKFKDLQFSEEDANFNWQESADKLRNERILFEKYGYLKDIILNSNVQLFLKLWEENVCLDVFLPGDPLIPVPTAVVILYMLHKRVSNTRLALFAAFIFNLNPIYVVIVAIIWSQLSKPGLPKQFRKTQPIEDESYREEKFTALNQLDDKKYDHILLGSDIGTLFTAALLSRVGHLCLVLNPMVGKSYELRMEREGWPDILSTENSVIGRVDKYQVRTILLNSCIVANFYK